MGAGLVLCTFNGFSKSELVAMQHGQLSMVTAYTPSIRHGAEILQHREIFSRSILISSSKNMLPLCSKLPLPLNLLQSACVCLQNIGFVSRHRIFHPIGLFPHLEK